MTEEELKYLVEEWIIKSDNTNDYCERSIIVEALKAAEEGDAVEAARWLRQVVPSLSGASSKFVCRPTCITKYGLGRE
jgi:hypothetical protein